MAQSSFPLVRGRTMRVTQLDACGVPITGDESVNVSEGFVSVGLTAEINEAEEIEVKNANGKTCVRDPGCPEFKGYTAEIVFCDVDPCLYAMMTGQSTIANEAGDVVGFKMNTDVNACDKAFALEVWAGVPGVACAGGEGAFGYVLLPFMQAGVVGDFTIENAAVSFTISGAKSKDGNTWDVGPYDVVLGAGSTPAKLAEPLEPNDHLAVLYTEVAPPAATDGCVAFPLA